MKKYSIYISSILVALTAIFQACTNGFEDPVSGPKVKGNIPWQANTTLAVTTDAESSSFLWVRDLLTFEEYWMNEEVKLHLDLVGDLQVNEVSSVDIYINAYEQDGYNHAAPYETRGQLLETISELGTEGYTLTIQASEVYALFKDKFENDRTVKLAQEGDKFEINWIIKTKSGEELDSRDSYEITDRFGFATRVEDYAPPVWAGEFDFEILTMTPTAEYYASITPGYTGVLNVSEVGPGEYSVDAVNFHYYDPYLYSAPLYFDFLSGETSLGKSYYSTKWKITKVEGPSIEIDWSYYYSAGYDIYMTVRLTRKDGKNWPENLHSK